ncbi:lon-related putative ATP-dependent protease [Caminicella sporogenes DSM 14501]|uniref:endopeptidase La n=1 Tax=Caminicella sporogenes DSM 14501 TaxID=1121266 RepID=A0A1M6MV27_9FIRM|nr:ATP-binding protein [Caminicella sporogenes]SHJ87276.1 lon-related putative ATP-dependent protease [Caminicella sporogenes DSM 14501]
MRKYKELSYEQLKMIYNPRDFKFKTTKELKSSYSIIGQERAVKAMEFGLDVKNSKYNIFVCGQKGTGKTSYTISSVKERAVKEKTPDDWCYVYNFREPNRPKAINLPAGKGREFKEDMEFLIRDLLTEVPKTFVSEDYEKNKNDILKEFQEKKSELLEELFDFGRRLGFEIRNAVSGLILVPIKNGKNLSDEEYDELSEREKEEYEKKAEELQIKAIEILKKIKILEKEMKKKLRDFEKMIAHFMVKPMIEVLIEKYKSYSRVLDYIKEVEEDIIENIADFKVLGEEDLGANIDIKKIAPRYYVNLFVDNSEQSGAPVIVECNPTYNNLAGLIEYENEKGTLKTDFTMIKAGAIHRANGGYLILQAQQLLGEPLSWIFLKRVLNTGEIKIESLRHLLGISSVATLNPEAVPVKLKIILIGSPYIYNLIYNYDEDFHKLFKIKVDFDSVMENNHENIMKMANFISYYCQSEGLRHFDKKGVIKVLEYSNRLAGSQKKLSTKFNKIIEILIEADVFAGYDGNKFITEKHVEKAIIEKKRRVNKIEEKINELYREGKIIIDVKGKKVGKINGLAIIDMGDYMFGRPNVITVSTYAGNNGIINIEREVKLSGNIHDKGVMILEGFLNERFCRREPLNLTTKICFEQSYSSIDGDSASSTELYAILSSIGDIPLKQYIGVTGSVNQKGEIQPVGGITEKIEGFYYTCKQLGFTDEQGVMIPFKNIDEIVLDDEIIEAVKRGKFHIYPVSSIEEGIEILTDKTYEEVEEIILSKMKEYNKTINFCEKN